MSVLSNGKLYEGNSRPPAGEPDILIPKWQCPQCGMWFTDKLLHIRRGCKNDFEKEKPMSIPCAKDQVLAKYDQAEVTRGTFGLVVVTDDTHAKKLGDGRAYWEEEAWISAAEELGK